MSTPAFTRHGTWWVTTPDGRSIQRTGRNALTYKEGEHSFKIGVEPGDFGEIVVLKNVVSAPDGWLLSHQEKTEIFERAMQLLALSGDRFIIE